MFLTMNKTDSKNISSALAWDPDNHWNKYENSGRISKGSSRMQSRAPTARSPGVGNTTSNPDQLNDSYYSLPPMTARSLYVEPQFKRIDLPSMIRVNVLQPPTVPKRTITMQTTKATDHNRKRVLKMQRDNHQMFHSVWKKWPYGDRVEKEEYRSKLREALKDQMVDLNERSREERLKEINYTMSVLDADEQFKVMDLQNKIDRLMRGINVTKKNQELMENVEKRSKMEQREILALEKALLEIFPINPRKTLK